MEGKGTMMALISGYNFVNHVIRSCVPPLIPFIVNEFSFNGAQQALLMSAFFQGYLVTQIPGGWLAQKVGGKVVAQLNLCGNACLLLLPTAAKFGANSLAACLCVIGLCQGPLVPTVSILQRNWLPTGPMRAWAIRIVNTGGRVARMVAMGTGPLLASRFGWRSIAYLYGTVASAFAIAFTLFGAEAPPSVMAAAAAEKAAAEKAAAESSQPKKKEAGFEWRIFSVPAVQALLCAQVASNTAVRTLIDVHNQSSVLILHPQPLISGTSTE
jgi:MFS family permease